MKEGSGSITSGEFVSFDYTYFYRVKKTHSDPLPFGDDTLLGSLPDSCSEEAEEADFCSTYSYEEGDVLSYDGDEYGNVLRREELIGLDILISPTGSTPVWRAIPYDCDLWTRENAGETSEK